MLGRGIYPQWFRRCKRRMHALGRRYGAEHPDHRKRLGPVVGFFIARGAVGPPLRLRA